MNPALPLLDAVAETLVKTLRSLEPEYPAADPEEVARFAARRGLPESERD
ncbi:MAG: hypothetical protein AB7V45_00465 [Candidatus Krumholzibacteriia bacterium]